MKLVRKMGSGCVGASEATERRSRGGLRPGIRAKLTQCTKPNKRVGQALELRDSGQGCEVKSDERETGRCR